MQSLASLTAAALAATFSHPYSTSLHRLPPEFLMVSGDPTQASPPSTVSTAVTATAPSCHTCSIAEFASPLEQRQHFKSDFHLLNLKLLRKNHPPLTLEQAEAHLASLTADESLSASGSPSDDMSDGSSLSDSELTKVPNQPLITAPTSLPHVNLTLYSAVAQSRAELEELRWPQTWAIFLYQAGHFAAAVYSGEGKCLLHKTEHRYMVRKKQGGVQSAQDEKNFKARSAGAMLRRHGEAEMRATIAATIRQWDLTACTRIFLGIPARARKLFVGEGGDTLRKGDARLRRVPFAVNRPTHAETLRVFNQLSTAWLSPPPLAAPRPAPAPPTTSAPTTPITPPPRPSLADSVFVPEPIHAAARANDVARVDVLVHDHPAALILLDDEGRTPLHVALAAHALEAAQRLLELGSDPCQRDFGGRLPIHVCPDSSARAVLRRFCLERPDAWDWAKACVEPAPSAEQEEARKERERLKRKAAQARKKEERSRAEAEAAAKAEAARVRCARCEKALDRVDKQALFHQQDETFCSQDCMRQRRRELLAGAAERRLQAGG